MASRGKRTTILDIAREAGVSAATVSRVLNNRDYPVKESLRKKILEASRRLNYRPNLFSQMLKGGENRVVGVIVPSISNPFYSQLVSDMEEICIASSRPLIICSSRHSPRVERQHLDMLEHQQVAGVLLSTMNSGRAYARRLEGMAAPCVLFDQVLDGYAGNSVYFDFRRGGYLATRHLIEKGHRRIAFASMPLDRASRRLVFEGYRDALREAGIDAQADMTVILDPEEKGTDIGVYQCGRAFAERLADCLPDAVFAMNDITAIGLMNALFEKGVRVPRDVSIVGFDDIPLASMTVPPLTTVRQSTALTAELAMRTLFRNIGDRALPPAHEVVEAELVERASVRRIAAAPAKGERRPTVVRR